MAPLHSAWATEHIYIFPHLINKLYFFEDLSARANAGKEENLKLKSENQFVRQHIENLISASGVFQTTDTESKIRN
uniref:Uncharacterized protein n=1 Tax=Piliocolobus tephrosceles TaxID=591936 RepID=A0A8C9I6E3_9PRIM